MPALLVGLSVGLVLPWRWLDPPTSAVMLADSRSVHVWRDLCVLPEPLVRAVIAAEDQRFASHHGFDLNELARALEARAAGGRLRGASTLSQQVAKNLYLWHGRSWVRKGLEAWLTLWIELLWPKWRILEVYLNVAEFAPSTYGVEAAAMRLWSVTAARLTERQAAAMAASLPSPRRYRADAPGPYLSERIGRILRDIPRVAVPALPDCE